MSPRSAVIERLRLIRLPIRSSSRVHLAVGVGMAALLASLLVPRAARSQQSASTAELVFQRYADRTVHIQISDVGSDAPSVTASAFFVSSSGHLVTNHHVVADLVSSPDEYRAELVSGDAPMPLRVVAVDVVHDIAILECDTAGVAYFDLLAVDPAQGTRLFAFGYPRRLELSIVEGIHNGLLEHRLYDRVHFTGSLNPGMSGGPTITADGRVVGINVSTHGDQLSFLVPVDRAIALLASVHQEGFSRPDDFHPIIAAQLLDHQDVYISQLLQRDFPTVSLGPYQVPTQPAGFFECWGETRRNEDWPYEFVDHQCEVPDRVFLASQYSAGDVHFFHRMAATTELNRFQFYALYTREFQTDAFWLTGSEEYLTDFRCDTGNVRHDAGTAFRVVFCARRHRRLPGLYDVVFKAAALGRRDVGIETTLLLTGVSFENAQALARRYLEAIKWTG